MDELESKPGIYTIAFLAGVMLFLISLVLPAFYTTSTPKVSEPVLNVYGAGWSVLAFGWAAFIEFEFRWLANPILLFSWYLYGQSKPAAAFMWVLISVGLSGSLLFAGALPTGQLVVPTVFKLGSGYWCWFSSQILMVFACVLRILKTEL